MDPLDGFEFSQSSLQDYIDCRRRFQLRYLKRVAWPAVQARPARENERHIQGGERFHRLAQQYLLGIPEAHLSRMADADEDQHLHAWWHNFLAVIPGTLNGTQHVEVTLTAPLENFRLIAKYDLVLIQPDGQVIIYDWKTSSRQPSRKWLSERMQTRVYPYLLVSAGADLNNGQPFSPEAVKMIYWFADPGMKPVTFTYSQMRWEEDGQHLRSLVNELAHLDSHNFTMAATQAPCGYCVYRSLCNRGTQAGSLGEEDTPEFEYDPAESLNFSLEQIGEISF